MTKEQEIDQEVRQALSDIHKAWDIKDLKLCRGYMEDLENIIREYEKEFV